MLHTLIAFAIVLGVAVLAHELGHFLAARAVGVRVLEFSFGFPPKLLTLFRRGGTEYTLGAIPFIGGYVRLGGAVPGEEPGPDGLNAKTVGQRMFVYAAGPAMSFALSALLFVVLALAVGVPARGPDAGVAKVLPGRPAALAGLQAGDHILRVDGRRVECDSAPATIRSAAGRAVTLTVQRGGREMQVTLTPTPAGQIGVSLEPAGPTLYRRASLPEAVAYGGACTARWTRDTVLGFGVLLADSRARDGVVGPLGIAKLAGGALRRGIATLLLFLAVISINLGVLNLLPFLALDGGHLALLTLEGIRGRALRPALELSIQAAGMGMLLAGMALLTVRDVAHWLGRSL